jgi:protein-tyrosine phosphatase
MFVRPSPVGRLDHICVTANAHGAAYGSRGVIDLHCHVLPGIDDGPATIDGSLALARAARAAGIDTVVATPHVSAHYPKNQPDLIERLVAQVGARLREERIDLEVLPGAELAIMSLAQLDPASLPRLGLGGGAWLLVEPPFAPVAPGLERLLLDLLDRGHKLVLAHPERCPVFHRDRRMLESLADAGVLLSITAGSLVGRFGAEVRRYALELARDGLVHNVTSDAHDCEQRAPGLTSELHEAGLAPLADWLTLEVPHAILRGLQIPPRPAVELDLSRPRWRLKRA